jgi:aminoglycoside 3-N-acetyltransferase
MTVTRSRLTADLRELGVREGGIAMVHTRMSAIGWVVGAAETVVLALRDALGPEGTLMAYASWEEHAYHEGERPQEHLDGYRAEPPAFDLATSEAARDHGRVPERVRTWPGARRSFHPEASVVAVGPRAGWLVEPHPDDDGYGARSPFARLVEAGGQVVMLGAPLDTVTLLHHAEAIARVPGKRMTTIRVRTPEGERELADGDVVYFPVGPAGAHRVGTPAMKASASPCSPTRTSSASSSTPTATRSASGDVTMRRSTT